MNTPSFAIGSEAQAQTSYFNQADFNYSMGDSQHFTHRNPSYVNLDSQDKEMYTEALPTLAPVPPNLHSSNSTSVMDHSTPLRRSPQKSQNTEHDLENIVEDGSISAFFILCYLR
ncbi:uncharacterized protein LOC117337199 [Pecten maximus]|uniref:uncharacterized protein LOC117337199 n=1 Tax=Pecten maximus TaxID=6579 RepID=UPI001458868F|nr:uncharacterized protein LOC117337199 [Pecten maximus]